MAVHPAAFVETIDRGTDSPESTRTVNLRLASGKGSVGRVQRLVELASSLMREAQVLARDKAFADESASLETLDLAKGFDFYDEVQRFEMALIKLALEQAEGNQARAARLLGLRATTLNSKIKAYDIQY